MNHTLTKENIKKLEEELDFRLTVKRAEIAKEKMIAAAHGDRSENAEYKEACAAYRENDNRIQYLMTMITTADVIENDNREADGTALRINGKARVRFVEEDEEDIITLVTTIDSDPASMRISIESDLGKALSGKRPGDLIEVDAPAGKYTIELLELLGN